MRIALLGTRGVPARYGGFETFAEELSARLVARGHSVVVYGRRAFGESPAPDGARHRGAEIVTTPTVMSKYAETPVHAVTSFLDLARRDADVVLLCNAANSPFAWLTYLRRRPLVVNVDGIERHRSKWNAFGKAWYLAGEAASLLFADRVVADAETIASYYRRIYGAHTTVIPYGVEPKPAPPGAVLAELGVRPGGYVLYVSRLEPENNALLVIRAHRRSGVPLPLVVVGDAPYASAYKAALRAEADERVIFAGYRFGDAYRELRTHCAFYVQATEVGGTHPALVEALGYGNCVVANGTPENLEVLGGAGVSYFRNDEEDLAAKLAALHGDPARCDEFRALAAARAAALYSWDVVTDRYERLFAEVIARGRGFANPGLPGGE